MDSDRDGMVVDVEQERVKIITYSASQLVTFERCNLKWWWEKVKGFKTPPSAGQQKGIEIHAQIENWINNGTTPSDLRAQDALKHIKADRSSLLSEREIRRDLHIPNRQFLGYVDITDLSDREIPGILDMKTMSDLKRYGKTEYQLIKDIQLNCYAYDTFDLVPTAKKCKVAHVQIQSKGAVKSNFVDVDLPKADVKERWNSYLKIIDNIEEVRTKTDPLEVNYNKSACNDYGGCPHRARCSATVFLTPEEEAPWDTNRWYNAWEKKGDEMLLPPDTTRRPEGAPPAVKLDKEETKSMTNPLEALMNMGKTENVTIEKPTLDKLSAFKQAIAGPPATREKLDAVTETAPAEEPKTKKGRAKKETAVAPAVETKPEPVAASAPITEPIEQTSTEEVTVVSAPKPVEDKDPGEIAFLFIDCYPVHGFPHAPVQLGIWLQPILEQIRVSTGCDWQFHEFRKATAILNQYARKAKLPEAMIVNDRSPEAVALREYLFAKAAKGIILQGTR